MFISVEEVKRATDATILDHWCKLFRHDVLREGTRPSEDSIIIAAIMSEMADRRLYKDPLVKTELSKVTITQKCAYFPSPIKKAL